MDCKRTCISLTLAAAIVGSLTVVPAAAQDLEGCDSFQRYVGQENYPKALEELTWCRRSVEDLHYDRIKQIVERTVLGYEPDGATVEGAMGMSMIESTYSNGSDRITLELTSGGAMGSAGATGLGALAGLAGAFGVRNQGTRQVRVAGLTGQLEEEDDEASLTLTLDSGMIIVVTGPDADTVEEFAEEIIPDLEDYLG